MRNANKTFLSRIEGPIFMGSSPDGHREIVAYFPYISVQSDSQEKP